jgi:hypothetical protein
MEWNEIRLIVPSAMNPTLLRDIETNYFLNFPAEMLKDRDLLAASRIFWSDILDIKLNSDCESHNWSLLVLIVSYSIHPITIFRDLSIWRNCVLWLELDWKSFDSNVVKLSWLRDYHGSVNWQSIVNRRDTVPIYGSDDCKYRGIFSACSVWPISWYSGIAPKEIEGYDMTFVGSRPLAPSWC